MTQLQTMLAETPFVSYSYAYPHKSAYRPFASPLPLREIWESEDRTDLSLYVHLPFCEYRCGFCNLFTLSNPQTDLATQYLQQLRVEARQVRDQLPDFHFSQLAIGGGTPTYLEPDELAQLFEILQQELHTSPEQIPASIEGSPATLTAEKVTLIRAQGVDRISLGIQSFDEQEALHLGRPQKRKEILQALDLVRSAGFPTLNLDLIYGADGQTAASFLNSLQQALAFRPEEIYLYPLYVRPLTGLGRKQQQWDDHRLTLYRAGRDFLLEHGYAQHSLRMFRLEDSTQPHDTQYCCQTDGMIGLGCGARSYTSRTHYSSEFAVGRSSVAAIIAHYLEQEPESFASVDYGFQLNCDEQRRRFLILSLLQTTGLSRDFYADTFGADVLDHFPALEELAEHGLARITADTIILTSTGLERSDTIGPWLYSEQVLQCMETFQCQ
ncbi:Oxygen-independent coproporphyrinogen-III oxidase 1 [Gimesia panareensis]|uniref:Oxygen-independent coproporphyrinogen-III oxidase 1 n=1 Tax=Gimesia panareensis TaxID=2527978 RepID=A0A517Q146_9PLAN|nr:STM4012 family radical SAM protein [Gimesia panareensis]QDT25326.1 Oxygen-independent coproporphyrinogen-III oxidase 1 [Gimesia panareensis]